MRDYLPIKPRMDAIWKHHQEKWSNEEYVSLETVKETLPFLKSTGYATEGSAGFDIPLQYDIEMNLDYPVFIDLGFGMAIPNGHVGLFFPRSGSGCREGYRSRNLVCVIDSDHRGNVGLTLTCDRKGTLKIRGEDGSPFITTTAKGQLSNITPVNKYIGAEINLGSPIKRIKRGTALIQCVIVPIKKFILHYLEDFEELPETERGHGGYGSTGNTL